MHKQTNIQKKDEANVPWNQVVKKNVSVLLYEVYLELCLVNILH